MNDHDQAVIHSSAEPNWRTPPALFQALQAEFDLTLDAAADVDSALCPVWCGPGSPIGVEDTLAAAPSDLGSVQRRIFLNPPYSRQLVSAYTTGRIKRGHGWESHPVDLQQARSYDIAEWAAWCWTLSQHGHTIVAVLPFAPQTVWYRQYVYGHDLTDAHDSPNTRRFVWSGHAAVQERRLPHRISFLTPTGAAAGNAGVNSVIVVWTPATGMVGPWTPWSVYWSWKA